MSIFKDIPVDPVLAQLIDSLRDYVMTEEEIEAQRRSWVRGEMAWGTDSDEERERVKWERENGD